MKKLIGRLLALLVLGYFLICLLAYFFQEQLLFHPKKLPTEQAYRYPYPFEELFIEVDDGVKLNALLFKADSSRGLVFYLHGNAGALDSWGHVAEDFLPHGYDVFIPDYRGFGKSEGEINSKEQFLADVEKLYLLMRERYTHEDIIITGFSVGTGPAAWLAAKYTPQLLILKAPYYSIADMVSHYYPFLPRQLLRYNFETYAYVKEVEAPVVLFHGTADGIIPYNSSLKLQELLKPADTLITIEGAGHNGISNHPQYTDALDKLLKED